MGGEVVVEARLAEGEAHGRYCRAAAPVVHGHVAAPVSADLVAVAHAHLVARPLREARHGVLPRGIRGAAVGHGRRRAPFHVAELSPRDAPVQHGHVVALGVGGDSPLHGHLVQPGAGLPNLLRRPVGRSFDVVESVEGLLGPVGLNLVRVGVEVADHAPHLVQVALQGTRGVALLALDAAQVHPAAVERVLHVRVGQGARHLGAKRDACRCGRSQARLGGRSRQGRGGLRRDGRAVLPVRDLAHVAYEGGRGDARAVRPHLEIVRFAAVQVPHGQLRRLRAFGLLVPGRLASGVVDLVAVA